MIDITAGSNNVSVFFNLGASATGTPIASLTASYVRTRETAVAIPLNALASPLSAWIAGGLVEVNPAAQPGIFRLDVPDGAFAAGPRELVVSLKTATDCISRSFLLTRVPNQTPAGAPNGLPILDANSGIKLSTYQIGMSPAEQVLVNPVNRLATDIQGYVTTTGTSPTDWTDAERQQIRFVLGMDGTKAQPASGPATVQAMQTQVNKLTFDTYGHVVAQVAAYGAGLGPNDLILLTPGNKLASDALGNVGVPDVTLASTGLDLITIDGLTLKTALRGIAGVSMGEIRYDTNTNTGTVSSATSAATILLTFAGNPEFTARTNVALNL